MSSTRRHLEQQITTLQTEHARLIEQEEQSSSDNERMQCSHAASIALTRINDAMKTLEVYEGERPQECAKWCGLSYCDENGCTNRPRSKPAFIDMPMSAWNGSLPIAQANPIDVNEGVMDYLNEHEVDIVN